MQRVSSLSARIANVKHARPKVRVVQTIKWSDGLMQKKEDLLKELCAGDAKLLAVLDACMQKTHNDKLTQNTRVSA